MLTADLMMLLRLNKRGVLIEKGQYKKGIICSLISDLINLDKLTLKERDSDLIYLKAIKGEKTGNKILDELYITIRDCPKEYTINDWVERFIESYYVYEEYLIESMIHREILIKETKKERLTRMIIAIILFIPFCFPGGIYYNNIAKPIHYKVKKLNLKLDSVNQLISSLKSLEIPNPSFLGLIIILKRTGLFRVLLYGENDDYLTKKFYQLQDHDFINQDMLLLVKYLTQSLNREPNKDFFYQQQPTNLS